MCNLDGTIRIVELQLQAPLQHVGDEQLAQYAINTGAHCANPCIGWPIHVDVVYKTAEFQPLGTTRSYVT
jgi:hypothetical protein